jgi:hypothetical protein
VNPYQFAERLEETTTSLIRHPMTRKFDNYSLVNYKASLLGY